jgi:hypothetical protein
MQLPYYVLKECFTGEHCQILPQLDPTVYNNFGYAIAEFYGPLPTYFISFLRLFIPSWGWALALAKLLFCFLPGVIVYKFIKELIKLSKFTAVTTTVQSSLIRSWRFSSFAPLISAIFMVFSFPVL